VTWINLLIIRIIFCLQYQQSEGDASMGGGEKTFWDLVADPRVIDKALDTENVDYNVTMAQTTRLLKAKTKC